jgi:iron complex outermembrane receptor protein
VRPDIACSIIKKKTLLLGSVAAAAVLTASSLYSGVYADDKLVVERMVVTAKRAPSLTSSNADDAKRSLARIPGAVSVVDAESYKDKFAYTLEDTFQLTPGVFAKKRFGEEVRLAVRGSGLSRGFHVRGIDLLQNGIPYNVADGTGDFHEIDPLLTSHIEVYKGGDSLQYGSSSLGGAINFVMPTAYSAKAPNLLRIEGGSYGTLRTHAEVSRIAGQADMFAAITASKANGWRQQSASKALRLSSNVGYKFNDTAETRVYLSYNAINNDLPGTLTLAQALNTPKMAAAANLTGNQQRNVRSVRAANKTSFLIGNATLLDIGAYVSYKGLFHPIFQVIDQGSTDFGFFTRLVTETEIAGHRNITTVGARYSWGRITAKQYVNISGSRGALTQDGKQRADTALLYAENQFFVVPSVALVTGIQGIHTTRDYTNNLAPARSDEASYTSASPKLGVLWDVTPTAQAYANVTRSFEAPIFGDLTATNLAGIQFSPLEPQSALTFEIGTRGTEGIVTWDLALYRSELRNELINYTTNPSIPAATFNAGKTRHQGIDAYLSLDIGKSFLRAEERLTLEQAYTFSDFQFKNDLQYGDNKLAGQPPHLYTAVLRFKSGDGWDIAPRVEWAPRGGFVDYANTLSAPGYATLGLEGGFDITKGVRLFFDARNLTDKRYVSSYTAITNATLVGTNVFYPGEGRSIFAGLTAAF